MPLKAFKGPFKSPRDHVFYLPVRFTDPCIYKDPAYKKNVFPEEMKSKGFLAARRS